MRPSREEDLRGAVPDHSIEYGVPAMSENEYLQRVVDYILQRVE